MSRELVNDFTYFQLQSSNLLFPIISEVNQNRANEK